MQKNCFLESQEKVIDIQKQINALCVDLGFCSPIFIDEGKKVEFTCCEAGFIKIVSWLYIQVFESGNNRLNFIIDKLELYSIEKFSSTKRYKKEIHSIRTFFQHNIDVTNPIDNTTMQNAKDWFYNRCDNFPPKTATQWSVCFYDLLLLSMIFFSNILFCVETIFQDEFRETIVQEFNILQNRTHSAIEFQKLAYEVAMDMGLEYIDIKHFCKKNIKTWNYELRSISGPYDFLTEARKRIERDLLRKSIMPITSKDIIEKLNIPPGPKVYQILNSAYYHYNNEPCDCDILLDKISKTL